MTVSSTDNRKEHLGNGVTTSFGTSPVVFFDNADILVYAVVTATGVATLLTENTHYTLTGGDGSTGTVDTSGGSSPYGAPASTITLAIVREVAATQGSDLVNNDINDAGVLEDALDRLTMLAQQNKAAVERAARLADSDVSGADMELPTPSASKLIGWNSDGDGLANYAASSLSDTIVPSAYMETLLDDTTAAAARTTLQAGSIYELLTSVAGTNTITAALAQSPAAYTAGDRFILIPANTNTGATTLNVTPSGGSALGAKNIFSFGAACVGGELIASVPVEVVYDGTQFNIISPAPRVGTWTPAITFTTAGNQSIAYTQQTGTYMKIGRKVTLNFFVITSTFTHTTASGNLNITGLPFAATNNSNPGFGGMAVQGITKANYTQFAPRVDVNTSVMRIVASGSAQNESTVAFGDMPTGGTVRLSGTVTYLAAT